MQTINVFLRPITLGLIALGVALCGTSLSRMARAEIFTGFPDGIVCKAPKFKIVFYVDRQDGDGVVWYKTMERQVAKIDKQGVFRRQNGRDCNGKTVEQLRKQGKTFDVIK